MWCCLLIKVSEIIFELFFTDTTVVIAEFLFLIQLNAIIGFLHHPPAGSFPRRAFFLGKRVFCPTP